MKFLGMVEFYQKFSSNFSALAYPLTSLLKKDTPLFWDESCQQAFLAIKGTLQNEPVLHTVDLIKDFVLHVDACDIGMGSMLQQEGDDKVFHPSTKGDIQLLRKRFRV